MISYQYRAIIILLFAFTLRIYHLSYQPSWSDETDLLYFSSQSVPDLIQNFDRPGWNGPLYHLFLHYWFAGTGTSIFALRYNSLLFSLLAVSLSYPLARLFLSGQNAAIFLSVLMSISPYLVWYAQDGKMYSLLLSMTIASLLTLAIACKKSSWQAFGTYLLITWASWYVHILAVLILPVHLILVYTFKKKFSIWLILAMCFIIGLLYMPLLRWQLPAWVSDFMTGHYFLELSSIIRTQLFVFTISTPSRYQLLTALPLIFLFVAGVYYAWKMTMFTCNVLIGYVTLPLLGIYFISLGMPIYTDRYLITIAPAFYSLCAVGFVVFAQKLPYLTLSILFILIIGSCLTIYIQSNNTLKPTINAFPTGAAYNFTERNTWAVCRGHAH